MATKSAKTKQRGRKAGGRASKARRDRPSVLAQDEDIDGCDFEVEERHATPDSALPQAKGGVEIARGKRARKRTREVWFSPKTRAPVFSLTWLPQVLIDAGLKVAVQPGWESRGRGDAGAIKGVICHHTAGPLGGNMPSLGVVTNGRPGLPGPLAQLCLGRDGTFYVVAAGRCNHAGRGDWQGFSAGNTNFIGIEAENTGLTSGPKAEPWPATQMDAYRRGVAAILKKVKANSIMACGHKEYALPPGRKVDPTFDMNEFRQQVAAIMAGIAPLHSVIPAMDSVGRPTLRRGDKGDLVKTLQKRLGLVQSGTFDAETEAKIREFQRDHALAPDGIVGPRTWATLESLSALEATGKKSPQGHMHRQVAAAYRRFEDR